MIFSCLIFFKILQNKETKLPNILFKKYIQKPKKIINHKLKKETIVFTVFTVFTE